MTIFMGLLLKLLKLLPTLENLKSSKPGRLEGLPWLALGLSLGLFTVTTGLLVNTTGNCCCSVSKTVRTGNWPGARPGKGLKDW